MTLKSILALCEKDESICVLSTNRWIYIPNESGEVDRIYAVTVGNFIKYAPEEVLSANVVGLRKSSPNLAFDIECPSSNTIIDDYGNIFVNCKPTDWKIET